MSSAFRPIGQEEKTCPVCNKIFVTAHGRNTHISNARSCSWYRHGKLRELSLEEEGGPLLFQEEPSPAPVHEEPDSQGAMEVLD